MRYTYMPFVLILQGFILFFSAHANGQTSLTTLITDLEKEHAQAISGFSNSLAQQLSSGNPKYQKYGGEIGNNYFQYYTKEIIVPALTKYFISLRNSPIDKSNYEKEFMALVDTLGKYRQKIAVNTKSTNAMFFGEKTNTRIETVTPDMQDPSWQSWYKHLQEYFGLDTFDFAKGPTLNDVLNSIANFIRAKGNQNLMASTEKTSMTVRNTTNVQIGSYSIESTLGQPMADINMFSKDSFQFSFLHAVALYGNLAELFFAPLDPKLRPDQLLQAIGRFLFYWSQAAIYRDGQAAAGEWIVQALARSASYNLIFSASWLGKENGSMAPNMHASVLEESTFMEQFITNASLQKEEPKK